MNEESIMVDIESLGTKPDAVICSMAAAKFDVNNPLPEDDLSYETFEVNFEIPTQIKSGRQTEKGTMEWWNKQPSDVRKIALGGSTMLDEGLQAFLDWVGPQEKIQYFFAKGSWFDFPMLSNATEAELKRPLIDNYWKVLDARTLYQRAAQGSNDRYVVLNATKELFKRHNLNAHDPLSDVLVQIKLLETVW